MTQVAMTGDYIIENFFVGISNYESDIMKEVEELPELYIQVLEEQEDKDLLLIFAAVLVALLFLEWWLQARENF